MATYGGGLKIAGKASATTTVNATLLTTTSGQYAIINLQGNSGTGGSDFVTVSIDGIPFFSATGASVFVTGLGIYVPPSSTVSVAFHSGGGGGASCTISGTIFSN